MSIRCQQFQHGVQLPDAIFESLEEAAVAVFWSLEHNDRWLGDAYDTDTGDLLMSREALDTMGAGFFDA